MFLMNSEWQTQGCRPHLRRPVKAGDYTMFRPVFIIEESAEGQAGAATQVSENSRER